MGDNEDKSESFSLFTASEDGPRVARSKNKHKWVVFGASVFASFLNFGIMASMGAMYIGMLDTFNAGRAKTALVQSLAIAIGLGFGVVSGLLINKFGIRTTSLIAGTLTAVGFFLSYFATSIYQLYGFISIVSSIGLITMSVSAVTCIGWTFTGRSKAIVLALQSLGAAISGFMWPFVLTSSIERYSLRGAFLILCGVLLNNIPIAVIFSKCKLESDTSMLAESASDITTIPTGKESYNKDTGVHETGFETNTDLDLSTTRNSSKRSEKYFNQICDKPPIYQTKHSERYVVDKNDIQIVGINIQNSKTGDIKTKRWSCNFRKTCLNRTVWLYFIFVFSIVLTMSALIGFLTVYQDINVSNGLTISQSDLSFMGYALCNILSRLLPIIPAKFPSINSFTIPILSSVAGVCGQLMFMTNKSFVASLIAMGLTAFSDGGLMASLQAILFQILPTKYQAVGLGFMFTAMGIVSAATGPIFGSIRDSTSSYQIVFLTTSTLMSAGAFLSFVCLILSSRFVQIYLNTLKDSKRIISRHQKSNQVT